MSLKFPPNLFGPDFTKAAGRSRVDFCPGFSGNPDSSKSSLFILRASPTSAVKKHKFNFYEEVEEFLSFFCSGCRPHVSTSSMKNFVCTYTAAELRATTGESYFESETPILQRMMKSDQT